MKQFFPFILVAFGIIVIFAGFVYDVLYAGISYPDPTPALTARYNFYSQIASIIRWSGMGVCVIGGAKITIQWLVRKKGNRINRDSVL